mgnify:CR=1 FL=1
MRADCIEKVRAAAGDRKLSDSKIKAIDDAISGKMRELARQDPEGWQAKSRDQRMTEAAQAAMADIEAAASRKEMLAGMQAIKVAETQGRIAEMKNSSAQKVTQSQAVIRDIQNSQNYVHAVHDDAVSGLGDMMAAAESKGAVRVQVYTDSQIGDIQQLIAGMQLGTVDMAYLGVGNSGGLRER